MQNKVMKISSGTFSRHPYPMDLIALESLAGNDGVKALSFCFSQPRGAVITTSSNSNVSSLFVIVMTFPSRCSSASIFTTLVESLISALLKAGFAMSSRIF
jgi:hypothetical protein